MKKLLQINLSVNCLSTGKIAEDIGKMAMQKGWESFIAGSIIGKNPSESEVIQIGTTNSLYIPYFEGLIFDNHCFGLSSRSATRQLISEIERIKPDVIQLHTLHAYYLNLKLLFEYFLTIDIPIVWTLHDCWSFTGHCAYFDAVECERWKTQCQKCPQLRQYPKSLGLFDNSRNNFKLKKELFTALGDRLHLVTVSKWLENIVKESFLKNKTIDMIHNGVDVEKFKPSYGKSIKPVVLGVAAAWDARKGFEDMIKLREMLPADKIDMVMIGLSEKQLNNLPNSIKGMTRTQNIHELAEWYSRSWAFVNPTYSDNFPTVNIESLACGTPVITYNTGGSPEAINVSTGSVVEKGNIKELANSVLNAIAIPFSIQKCRDRALQKFNCSRQFAKYIDIYESLQ